MLWSVRTRLILSLGILLAASASLARADGAACAESISWLGRSAAPATHLDALVAPPPGFARRPVADPFGAWLRHVPLRDGNPEVRLHDGRLKARRDVAHAVLDLDTGRANLQQCADTVLRLRAEWLWSEGRHDDLAFRFTSGHLSRWSDWAAGMRPRVSGSKVSFEKIAPPDASRASFRAWLDSVFTYAGTISLRRDLKPVEPAARIEPGDVFVQAGSPGHAVIVLDVVENVATGERRFLLAQGFMPAQDAHVLRNPGATDGPWYPERFGTRLVTPEWTFDAGDRRRF